MTESDKFQKGQMVVITLAPSGIGTSIRGDIAGTPEKFIWIYPEEFLIGQVVGRICHTDYLKSAIWKILTPEGVAHIWDGDIADDDLAVEVLTDEKADWIMLNCTYNQDLGKHKIDKTKQIILDFIRTSLGAMAAQTTYSKP